MFLEIWVHCSWRTRWNTATNIASVEKGKEGLWGAYACTNMIIQAQPLLNMLGFSPLDSVNQIQHIFTPLL